jgi:hypothetical protein
MFASSYTYGTAWNYAKGASGSGWRPADGGPTRGSRQPPDGRTVMAKGQKRTSREAKKPKADKKKLAPPPGTVSSAFAKPKAAAPAVEKRK